MKIQLIKIVNGFEAFTHLTANNDLPFALAWKIADILEIMEKHVKRFNASKDDLVKNYGKPDPKNKDMYLILDKDRKEFEKHMQELSDHDIEIEYEKLSKSELLNADLKVTSKVNMMALRPFIDGD